VRDTERSVERAVFQCFFEPGDLAGDADRARAEMDLHLEYNLRLGAFTITPLIDVFAEVNAMKAAARRRGEDVIDLVISALFEAADEDSATGGPDLVRAIYPSVATITAEGFQAVEEAEIADRFRTLVDLLHETRGPLAGGTLS